jgi:hypothetical protein
MDIDTIVNACSSLFNQRHEIKKTLKNNDEQNTWQKETLHFYRVQLEPYIFNYLNYTYGKKLDDFWKTHQFPKKSKYAFVIVERRIHPNWWFVLRNIAWAAPHLSLYIFCSDINYEFIKSILGDKATNVNIQIWFKGINSVEEGFKEYSLTFLMPQFYKLIDAEYFINFQMDSYFLQKIPDWIFQGTYYGSPWCWSAHRAGNGGLAVRNTKLLTELCTKELNNIFDNGGEDTFISDALIKHNFKYPEFDFRIKVFQENFPTEYIPIGTHQFWTYISNYNLSDRDIFTKNIKKLLTLIDL